ncbi:MAG TPA: glycosyltransferase [Terriglobales bacterium]|nr:glycosyltransferase [Terriglobales bacterium]
MALKILIATATVVAYTWVGYPALLWFMNSLRGSRKTPVLVKNSPFVSIVIAVHNEQATIADKLRNCIDLTYPHDQLEIVVASDGSTDRTSEIVHEFAARDARIRWIESDSRVGKSGAQNLASTAAKGDLLLFTDASTTLPPSSLKKMLDNFADPKVGLVTATVFFGHPQDAVEQGQGFYWRYELLLRNAESDLGILATGSGQALLVRRELFRPLPSCYGDDCIMPLDVRLQGYRVVQDREAIVFDTMPHSIEGELRARIRMTARNWAGTLARPALLNPLRFPLTSLGLVSHKLLRWLTPFFLSAMLIASALLALQGGASILLWTQLAFYASAIVGWQLATKKKPAYVFGYSFSFCLANVGFLLGIVKALRNQKIVAYERALP